MKGICVNIKNPMNTKPQHPIITSNALTDPMYSLEALIKLLSVNHKSKGNCG